MSCHSSSAKISRLAGVLSGGIAQLAGQRGFYAGLGLAGVAGALILARRLAKARPVQMIKFKPIPQLPARLKLQPVPAKAGQRCAGCQTPAGSKPGAWYLIKRDAYCQDCAPAAARQLDADLALPEVVPVSLDVSPSDQTAPASSTTAVTALPPERRVKTQLQPSRVRVRFGESAQGPAWYIAHQAYVALKSNGLDTGLALIPNLSQANGQISEDSSRWWIGHIDSGKPLCGPYPLVMASGLAEVLAQLDWTRPEAELTELELKRAAATVTAFEQELKRQGLSGQGSNSSAAPQPPASNDSLTGQLMADGYGGLARVLADNGETLLMVDHLGTRYELARPEARRPGRHDFELNRVAMSFDPTTETVHCAGCGRSSGDSQADERWYRMGWQTHCPGCARTYAAEEAYLLDEEVGT